MRLVERRIGISAKLNYVIITLIRSIRTIIGQHTYFPWCCMGTDSIPDPRFIYCSQGNCSAKWLDTGWQLRPSQRTGAFHQVSNLALFRHGSGEKTEVQKNLLLPPVRLKRKWKKSSLFDMQRLWYFQNIYFCFDRANSKEMWVTSQS